MSRTQRQRRRKAAERRSKRRGERPKTLSAGLARLGVASPCPSIACPCEVCEGERQRRAGSVTLGIERRIAAAKRRAHRAAERAEDAAAALGAEKRPSDLVDLLDAEAEEIEAESRALLAVDAAWAAGIDPKWADPIPDDPRSKLLRCGHCGRPSVYLERCGRLGELTAACVTCGSMSCEFVPEPEPQRISCLGCERVFYSHRSWCPFCGVGPGRVTCHTCGFGGPAANFEDSEGCSTCGEPSGRLEPPIAEYPGGWGDQSPADAPPVLGNRRRLAQAQRRAKEPEVPEPVEPDPILIIPNARPVDPADLIKPFPGCGGGDELPHDLDGYPFPSEM